jgi:HNH endonuclease
MLTIDRAEQLLAYDADTGILRWRVTNSNRCVAGSRAGTVTEITPRYSRRQIRIDGKIYREHRVIWLLVTGEWPPEGREISHKNSDR